MKTRIFLAMLFVALTMSYTSAQCTNTKQGSCQGSQMHHKGNGCGGGMDCMSESCGAMKDGAHMRNGFGSGFMEDNGPCGPESCTPNHSMGKKGKKGKNGHMNIVPLTEEQKASVYEFYQPLAPHRVTLFKSIEKKNPKHFNRIIYHAYKKMMFMQDLKEKNPKEYETYLALFKTESSVHALVAQYKEAKNSSQKNRIKREMEKQLSILFDLREAQHQERIEKMNKRVVELEKNLAERKRNKNEIVKKHLMDITAKEDGLQW